MVLGMRRSAQRTTFFLFSGTLTIFFYYGNKIKHCRRTPLLLVLGPRRDSTGRMIYDVFISELINLALALHDDERVMASRDVVKYVHE